MISSFDHYIYIYTIPIYISLVLYFIYSFVHSFMHSLNRFHLNNNHMPRSTVGFRDTVANNNKQSPTYH